MLLQPLMDKLTQLHLPAFRKGIEEQITNPKYGELSFEERLSILVDLELLQRDSSRLNRYLKKAHFHLDAVLEDLIFHLPEAWTSTRYWNCLKAVGSPRSSM